MFEGRSLSEVAYKELLEFLKEGTEEGIRLDYKEGWVADAPKVACSFANTAGGLLVVGVKEKRGPNNEKLKIPDPNDVPGLKPLSLPKSSLIG